MANPSRFKGQKASKVSNELFDKSYRMKLSLHGQKLLYGLASGLSETADMFPRWHVKIQDLFKYLNLSEDNNSRYDAVREAFADVSKNPLEYRINEMRWGGMPWLTFYKFDGTVSDYIELEINHEAKKFLLSLKNYCLLEMKYYAKFTSEYAMFLYPRLRSIANQKHPKLELALSEIVELTNNEKTKAYTTSADANKNILARIIGIHRPKREEHWRSLTAKDKISGEMVEVGALAEINALSDLYVTCDVTKSGKSYDSVIFHVTLKGETYQGKRKAIRKAHRTDFRSPTKRKQVIEAVTNGQLFPSAVSMQTVKDIAETENKSVPEIMSKYGYRASSDGKMAVPVQVKP